ncbi:MAG: hypothetical protein KGI06_00115 [Candidatus Micrarchaeota archaeon]|nr:hypothetical protein [Candidatus Micrarchaeota archaeon]
MLKPYGYFGLALVVFAEINFSLKIQPFAAWYIPIVWYGFILFVDSVVFRIKKKSIISTYPKEFVLMLVVSVPFWLIFELYNFFTVSWIYTNYVWYLHLVDFTTIMPAVLEVFSLISALGIASSLDSMKNHAGKTRSSTPLQSAVIKFLVAVGAFAVVIPILAPVIGFPLMWIGIFLFIDPLNYLTGKPSIIAKVSKGSKGILIRLFLSGIVMGFFWEFWNFQAYPKWTYNLPSFVPAIKLFEMPLLGYLGYLPFAIEVFLFYALLRSFVFNYENPLLSM